MKNDAETASTSLIDNERKKSAFTLTDLLVVVGVLTLLMALFASSRVRAAAGSPASVCQDNLRRLSLAWYLYAGDQGGRLVNNFDISDTLDTITGKTYLNWANNVMTWTTDPSVTNLQLTASSKLHPYLGNDPSVFRCPSDTYLSPAQVKAGWTQRARTYSMNGCLGSPFPHPSVSSPTVAGVSEWCPERRQFLNLANISHPSGIFTFLEESPDSLNDGMYLHGCASFNTWNDLPASFHDGACNFVFADGHVELHPWLYDATKAPVSFNGGWGPITFTSRTRDDFQWVLDRTSVPLTEVAANRAGTDQMQITWARLTTNYVVQVTDQLSSGTWTNAELTPDRSIGQNAVRVPLEGSQRFFRLAR
jgi:prepilin-type processing-associated H-X9-DG protein